MAAIAVSIPATSTAAVVSAVAASSAQGAGSAGVGAGTVAGPAAGLATTWIMSKVIRMNGRSPQEQAVVGRGFGNAVIGVWIMVAVLIAALLFGGDVLKQSPWTMAIGVTVWTAVLLSGIIRLSSQMETDVARIRIETGTTDAEYAPVLAARGMTPAGPRRYESPWRILGLPLLAFASGGLDTGGFRSRWARGWIAIGDGAISPLLAIGGLAIAPIAIGGATVGIVSLSFLGVAVGGLALPEILRAEAQRGESSATGSRRPIKGVIMVLDEEEKVHHFSRHLMDPETGIAYDDPAPNTFSFNSPYGACPTCNGLGRIEKITRESVIPEKISFEEALHFAWSLPVSTTTLGCTTEQQIKDDIQYLHS